MESASASERRDPGKAQSFGYIRGGIKAKFDRSYAVERGIEIYVAERERWAVILIDANMV